MIISGNRTATELIRCMRGVLCEKVIADDDGDGNGGDDDDNYGDGGGDYDDDYTLYKQYFKAIKKCQ